MIEMLLAMAIAGVLAAIGTPRLLGAIDHARVAKAIGDVRALQTDIETYRAGTGKLPMSLADIGRGSMEDPWGNSYQYLNFSAGKGVGGARKDRFLVPLNSEYDLYSMGKDGTSTPPIAAFSSRDDIIRANDGGFIGLAERY